MKIVMKLVGLMKRVAMWRRNRLLSREIQQFLEDQKQKRFQNQFHIGVAQQLVATGRMTPEEFQQFLHAPLMHQAATLAGARTKAS